MPTAPRYDQPQVQQQALPTARVQGDTTLANFGGGQSAEALGNTVRGVSNDFMAIVQKEKQKADDTATKDALNQTVKLSNDLMFDPKNGAVTKQGKDAFGVIDDYTSQYDQGTDEIYNSLKNQDQRDAYKMMKAQYRNGLEESLQKHVRGESVKFEEQTFRSLVATNQDDAVLHFRDPDRIAQSLDVQRKAIESHADQNGWDADQKKQALAEASSKTHSGVIDQFLALGQDEAAKKYYDSNKDDINGAYRTDIDKKLEEGSIKGEAQRTTDKLFLKHDDLMGALAETKKIDDIKLRDETERRVEHAYAVKKSAEVEDRTSAYQKVSQLADTGSIDSVHNSAQWSKLSISEKNATDNYMMEKISGKNVQTDRATYHELNQMATGERAKFLDINLSSPDYKYKLSETDFKFFEGLQSKAKSGNTTELDGYESKNQVVDSIIQQGGVDVKNKSTVNQNRYHAIRDTIDAAVADQAQTTGKKPSHEDIRKIAKQAMVSHITEKSIWGDTKKYAGELQLSKKDREALDWASDPLNANDLRAAAIRKKLKVDDGI